MNDNRWWIWIVVVFVLLAFRGLGALLRTVKRANTGTADSGMDRMNAAAERILKERAQSGANQSGANPLPRTGVKSRKPAATSKPRPQHQHVVPKTPSTPAVIRRGGLLSASREPVIQRRR
jgi:hypothetical protein